MTSLEYSSTWSWEAEAQLLESFSKLVERREAVKLYVAHELAKLFAVESRILACALASACTRNTGTGYTRLLEIDSRAGASYMPVTHTRLSSCLWAVLYVIYTAQIIWLHTQAKRNRLLSRHYCVIYLLVYTHGSGAYTYVSTKLTGLFECAAELRKCSQYHMQGRSYHRGSCLSHQFSQLYTILTEPRACHDKFVCWLSTRTFTV